MEKVGDSLGHSIFLDLGLQVLPLVHPLVRGPFVGQFQDFFLGLVVAVKGIAGNTCFFDQFRNGNLRQILFFHQVQEGRFNGFTGNLIGFLVGLVEVFQGFRGNLSLGHRFSFAKFRQVWMGFSFTVTSEDQTGVLGYFSCYNNCKRRWGPCQLKVPYLRKLEENDQMENCGGFGL